MKLNPFRPGHPVGPGMFAGRAKELEALEAALLHTKFGRPSNFMIIGERGIGKSSLFLYAKLLAQGGDIAEEQCDFLVVDTDLDRTVTQAGLIRKIELGLRRTLRANEKGRQFLSDAWSFLQRIEAAGFGIKDGSRESLPDTLLEEFADGLAETINRMCDNKDSKDLFNANYDGVLLLLDEADNASSELQLGAFLKLLLERLQRRSCERLCVGLAGLPELRSVLLDSHPSSIRLFKELELDRLSRDDVSYAVKRAMEAARHLNSNSYIVTDDGVEALFSLSEGFPHFVQQYGYSAFEIDEDRSIDSDDVLEGGFGSGGALETIGNQYYRTDFYQKIRKDSYRQVLRIMAEHLDRWVTKSQIRSQFRGKATTLDNAIYSLRERNIIVSKEGARGTYRLRNKGFAWWVKMYTSDRQQLESQLRESGV